MSEHIDIIVVGAGPAGLLAALAAAGCGKRVVLLEQLAKPGLKLAATGGGHCNLTNVLDQERFMAAFGRFGRFMAPALTALSADGLRQFLRRLGVESDVTDGFHVFPRSQSAWDVQRALVTECGRRRVDIRCNQAVRQLCVHDGRICGVRTADGELSATHVILTTGGASYPELGGTGSGFGLARAAGHSIAPPLPALVALLTTDAWVPSCAGITFPACDAWLEVKGRTGRGPRHGAFLFTHRGVSGPAVLDLSGDATALLAAQPEVTLRVNLLPETTAATWSARFAEWRTASGKRKVSNLLDQFLPASLATAFAEQAQAGETIASQLSAPQRDRLVESLTALPLHITGTEGFRRAMVTRGGVNLKEVHSHNLESRMVTGLFFAGEVLDLDGPCGGYNLQWAFSSGWLAGLNAGGVLP